MGSSADPEVKAEGRPFCHPIDPVCPTHPASELRSALRDPGVSAKDSRSPPGDPVQPRRPPDGPSDYRGEADVHWFIGMSVGGGVLEG